VKKVIALLEKIGHGDTDFADARRAGRREEGPRPVIVKFIRKRDKFAVLLAKKELSKNNDTKTIYINPELTRLDAARHKQLRAKGKALKQGSPNLKFTVHNNTLFTDLDGQKARYKFQEDGKIAQLTQ